MVDEEAAVRGLSAWRVKARFIDTVGRWKRGRVFFKKFRASIRTDREEKKRGNGEERDGEREEEKSRDVSTEGGNVEEIARDSVRQ